MLETGEFTFERDILMFKYRLMLYLCHLFLLLFTTLFSINVFSVFYFIHSSFIARSNAKTYIFINLHASA